MAKVHINSGACGFSTTVEAKMNGDKCTIAIATDCKAIKTLAAELTEVEPFQEISFRGKGPKTLELGATHCYHTACPVPVGIIKAIEVAAGLNLPVDTSIKFIDE